MHGMPGLPGKILAFLVSLIAASLPITGFYIWWGKKHKQKYKPNYGIKSHPLFTHQIHSNKRKLKLRLHAKLQKNVSERGFLMLIIRILATTCKILKKNIAKFHFCDNFDLCLFLNYFFC